MKQEAPQLMLKRILSVSEILAKVASPQEVEKRELVKQPQVQAERDRKIS